MAKDETERRNRLSKDDWIREVGAVLLAEGPEGLRISRIARRLGVTPGSFYWHFRDRDQLRDMWVRHWMEKMLLNAAAAARRAGEGSVQVRTLPQILLSQRLPELDAAMRRWAVEDPVVATAVARADDLRLRVVATMFEEAGLDGDQAESGAKLVVWAFCGSGFVDARERAAGLNDLVELLLRDADRPGRRATLTDRASQPTEGSAPV